MSLPAPPATDPVWGTDANFTNGSTGIPGTPTKIQPTAGEKAEGHVPGTLPWPQVQNWWMNLVYLWVLYVKALVAAFFWSPTVSYGLQAARYKALGTTLVNGDFTIAAAWGGGFSQAVGGKDSAGFCSITAGAGGGLAANPRVILTFHDGVFPNTPIVIANCTDDTGSVNSFPVAVVPAVDKVFFFPTMTPTAGVNYTIRWWVIAL